MLEIRSSIYSREGQSSRLAERFVAQWRAAHPGGRVVVRDLAQAPIPHLDAERFGAFVTKPGERTPEQQATVEYSDALIAELQLADTLVLGVPMYNFGIPSTLKAYFDHVARAGVTFRYTANGPIGLLAGKSAVVFATRGGLYAGTANDTQTPYLRAFLAFIGIEEVEFVFAEGLAIGEASRLQALAGAHAKIDAMLEPALEAA